MNKILLRLVAFLVFLIGIYLAGPKPERQDYIQNLPEVPNDLDALDSYVSNLSAGLALRPKSEATIVWANDTMRQKTPIALVYLHGFSATWYEGHPLHTNLAKRLGANLFLARIASHGEVSDDPLLNYTAEAAWFSACEALAIGRQLGHKVVVIGTSTGATLGLGLASKFPVDMLINLSPNIEVNDPSAFLLNDPWGLQIAKLVLGGDFRSWEADDSSKTYWHTRYRIESLTQMQQLLEDWMTPATFEAIDCPVFTGYYYKSETEQDPVVRVSAMLKMHDQLGTTNGNKEAVSFPQAGDHVIGSSIKSNSSKEVEEAVFQFIQTHSN